MKLWISDGESELEKNMILIKVFNTFFLKKSNYNNRTIEGLKELQRNTEICK